MQKIFLTVATLTSSLLFTGCVAKYKAVGSFDSYNEVFIGNVESYPLSGGGGVFTLQGKNSGLTCSGTASKPIFATLTCSGQEGYLHAKCTDGLTLNGKWYAESCTQGYGEGTDSNNKNFSFKFGYSDAEANKIAEEQLIISKNKKEYITYKPKEVREKLGYSTGTGFFAASNGYILTNYHVIDESKTVTVKTFDNKTYEANVILKDKNNDIAIIKIDSIDYKPLSIGKSNFIKKGAEVMTLGYPLVSIQGQSQKATFGRVNSLSGVDDDIRFFQIDVPIQPGNSGGPILDKKGNVVGLATATLNQVEVLKQSGTLPQNVNYSVKSDYALIMLSQLTEIELSNNKVTDKSFEDIIIENEKSVALIIAK